MAVLRSRKGLGGRIVVIAFPGLGFVGTIAGRYLVEKWDMEWDGYVYDERLPPVGRVKRGKLLYPINIFSKENVSVVLSETVIPVEAVWDVSRTIVSRAKKDGARLLIPISGVLMTEGENVFGIPSGGAARKVLRDHGIEEIENGVITGISAAILLVSKEMGVPTILLLGPATSQRDFNAALVVLRALSTITGASISTEELLEMAHRYEHEMKVLEERMRYPQTPMYG